MLINDSIPHRRERKSAENVTTTVKMDCIRTSWKELKNELFGLFDSCKGIAINRNENTEAFICFVCIVSSPSDSAKGSDFAGHFQALTFLAVLFRQKTWLVKNVYSGRTVYRYIEIFETWKEAKYQGRRIIHVLM